MYSYIYTVYYSNHQPPNWACDAGASWRSGDSLDDPGLAMWGPSTASDFLVNKYHSNPTDSLE